MMDTTQYVKTIAGQTNLRPKQVAAVTALFDEGNTVPFIARYRKEMTDSMDEDQIRAVQALLDKLRTLDQRRETVLASIEEQGKLTPELRGQIMGVESLTVLEDLYAPYKPKRRTRASIAREKGLQPLADLILNQQRGNQSLEELVQPYLNDEVATIEEALAGAQDIVAEAISEHAEVRGAVRAKAMKWGLTRSQKVKDADDPKGVYETYYDFEYRVDRLQPHQILAINRGETEKVLKVSVDLAERDWREPVESVFRSDRRSPLASVLQVAILDAAVRLLLPAIERDVRRELSEKAEAHAIQVFANNLRGLLNQPPLAGRVILGIDPGFRSGCKVAVIDSTGKLLDTATIYPHEPQKDWNKALYVLAALVQKHDVTLISIGNGTASRETERLVAELTRQSENVNYLIVSEAGASVYSASPLAKQEMPDLDVSIRGAVSIARRVQDPLAELVKIEPKAIGVGMYQHDVDQTQLTNALDGVVETVVNRVGVDVNTASPALLTHVAGIGPKLAEKIVAHRESNGAFKNRKALNKVAGLGPKAFEQSAGFMRVRGGDQPLDMTAIHPESYKIAEQIMKRAKIGLDMPLEMRESVLRPLRENAAELAEEIGVGVPTLIDIFEQLVRPGRDPREDLPTPILRSDVLSMEDLMTGMRLNGTARNVVDFGVFVDIGVKQDGLLHRSQIPRGTQINVGDVLEVEIVNIDHERGRIGLTIPLQA